MGFDIRFRAVVLADEEIDAALDGVTALHRKDRLDGWTRPASTGAATSPRAGLLLSATGTLFAARLARDVAMMLGEDHRAVQDAVRDYVQAEIAPQAAAVGPRRTLPGGRAARPGRARLLRRRGAAEWDGAGLDYLALAVILEEIAAGDGATRPSSASTTARSARS